MRTRGSPRECRRRTLFAKARDARRHKGDVFAFAAYAARCGITAGDDFAEDGKVGFDVEEALRSAKTHTETGNDFVKDEERAVFVGKFKGFLVVIEVNGASAASGPRVQR